MDDELKNILDNELIMYHDNKYVIRYSNDIQLFSPLKKIHTIKFEDKLYTPYYSSIDQKVVFGFINDNEIKYILFDNYKVDSKFNRLNNFEWYDRFIFTFED